MSQWDIEHHESWGGHHCPPYNLWPLFPPRDEHRSLSLSWMDICGPSPPSDMLPTSRIAVSLPILVFLSFVPIPRFSLSFLWRWKPYLGILNLQINSYPKVLEGERRKDQILPYETILQENPTRPKVEKPHRAVVSCLNVCSRFFCANIMILPFSYLKQFHQRDKQVRIPTIKASELFVAPRIFWSTFN